MTVDVLKFTTRLRDGVVVDRLALNKVPTADMDQVMYDIYKGSGGQVIYTDSVDQLLGPKALFTALESNSPMLSMILEYNLIFLSETERTTIERFALLRASIENTFQMRKPAPPPLPLYPFAEVPAGWSVTKLGFTKRYISRSGYRIGNATAERIWKAVAPFWAGHVTKAPAGYRVPASGYEKMAVFYADRIEIGCQTVRRYELEAAALTLGWAFPESKAK